MLYCTGCCCLFEICVLCSCVRLMCSKIRYDASCFRTGDFEGAVTSREPAVCRLLVGGQRCNKGSQPIIEISSNSFSFSSFYLCITCSLARVDYCFIAHRRRWNVSNHHESMSEWILILQHRSKQKTDI
jgi:hypothetical protein